MCSSVYCIACNFAFSCSKKKLQWKELSEVMCRMGKVTKKRLTRAEAKMLPTKERVTRGPN